MPESERCSEYALRSVLHVLTCDVLLELPVRKIRTCVKLLTLETTTSESLDREIAQLLYQFFFFTRLSLYPRKHGVLHESRTTNPANQTCRYQYGCLF